MLKDILLLNNGDRSLDELIRQQHSEAYVTGDLDEASSVLKQSHISLVLVVFASAQPDELERLEMLIARFPGLIWIGLIERDLYANPRLKRLLAACFHDFHSFPIDPVRLCHSLGHAIGMSRLLAECEPESSCPRYLLGHSMPMVQLREQIARLKRCHLPVLVTGPSGTGKELVARELHSSSLGEGSPFVAVNCGAIPSQLIQSELFGHVKGAFTGAQERKIGKVEAADGGTLFLDEIGELPLEAQVILLRFLQEQTIEIVGSHTPREVNVRIIAATNIDIEQAVANGTFREDLYYRLNVVRLRLPSLRERGDDILLLAEHFLAEMQDGRVLTLSQQARRALLSHNWPGNVRELRNRVLRAAAMCDGALIDKDDLDLGEPESCPSGSLKDARDQAERQILALSLANNAEQLDEVARQLDVSRATLYRLLKKHGLC